MIVHVLVLSFCVASKLKKEIHVYYRRGQTL